MQKKNLFSSGRYRTSDIDLKGTYSYGPNGTYVTDTKGEPSNKFNMKVFNGATLNVDESQADHFDNYEAAVVNRLMTNFATGQGAENYNFPTNGIISSKFLTSDILKSALSDFNAGRLKGGEPTQYNFGGKELGKDFFKDRYSFFHYRPYWFWNYPDESKQGRSANTNIQYHQLNIGRPC